MKKKDPQEWGYWILMLMLLFIHSCDKKEILQPRGTPLPELTEPIPYEALGSGKIVFERIGPYPGYWSGWYVIDVNQRKTRGIEFDTNVFSPRISPDGEKIAFYAQALYLMNVGGTEAQRITKGGSGYMTAWSPDSRKLYFRQDSPPRLYSQSAVTDATDLQLIKTFIIQTEPDGLEYIIEPSGAVTVSPEGMIAYACNVNRQRGLAGLYVMDNDGSNLTLILPLFPNRLFDSPVFSPDGSKIYFFSIETDSSGAYTAADLMNVNADGSGLITLASLPVSGSKEWYYSVDKATTIFLTISPDGEKLLFNLPEGDFNSHIYLINVDGSELAQVTFAEGVTDRCVSWGNKYK